MSETTTSNDMSGDTFRITTRTPFKLKRRPGIKSVVMASETAEVKLNGECMDIYQDREPDSILHIVKISIGKHATQALTAFFDA